MNPLVLILQYPPPCQLHLKIREINCICALSSGKYLYLLRLRLDHNALSWVINACLMDRKETLGFYVDSISSLSGLVLFFAWNLFF